MTEVSAVKCTRNRL